MAITKTLGGDRIGTGKKMQVRMHNFERSTHNLSRDWKSSMTVGTLIPCFNEVGLPGDSFDIDIESIVKTQPTTGPLFGSFKMQVDFYSCPMRLYNGALHNNALGIGLKMSEIKFPRIVATTQQLFNPSSLMAYLGIRGIRGNVTNKISYNAVRHFAYYDIFKNYYSNKQEKNCYMCSNQYWSLNAIQGGSIQGYNSKISNFTNVSNNEWQCIPTDLENNWSSMTIGFNFDITQNYLDEMVRQHKTCYITFWLNANGTNTIKFPITETNTSGEQWSFIINNADKRMTFSFGPGGLESMLTYLGATTFSVHKVLISDFPEFYSKSIALTPIELTVFDNARERILSSGKDPGTINENYNYSPYVQAANVMQGALSGVMVKTYLSDIFNNWLDSETIEGENGIAAITSVDTSSGSFTIDSLILANKVYNMLNRIAVSGGTYDDWQEVVYGEEMSLRAESPIYLGGMSREIYFEEVVSTSDATAEGSEVPLGSIAGKGKQSDKKGGSVSFRVNEPSIIMGIVSLTPRIDYSQGNDWFVYLNSIDELHKPNLDGIGFQDLLARNMICTSKYADAVGKQPAWINYMTAYNQNYGDFATGGSLEHMVLNRNYNWAEPDFTTYIDPRKYNYIFADASLEAQNFWVQLGFRCTARRKMSAKVMPNL